MATANHTFSTDPALYIFTSLTAGSSHIVTATSRLETILRANRVPFKAVDLAVDQKARMLWGRRAGKDESGRARKMPALVQEGMVLGDIVEIEDWNEYGELKQHVKIYYDEETIPNIHNKPKDPPMKKKKKVTTKAGATAKPASASTSAGAEGSSSTGEAGPAPPPAPPMPASGEIPAIKKEGTSEDAPKKGESKIDKVAEKVTMPIRSVAEEAAQKAKELRLQALREKVHGSKAGKGKKEEEEKTKAEKTEKDGDKNAVSAEAVAQKPSEDDASEEKQKQQQDPADIGQPGSAVSLVSEASKSGLVATGAQNANNTSVQDSTTGTWGVMSSPSTGTLPQEEMVQSPTTARWKSIENLEPLVTSHRGSMVAAASQEEIQALEKAEAIPEAEEELSDESSEDEDGKGTDIVKETPDVKVPRNVEQPVAAASNEEIQTVEKTVAIPEAPEEEDESSSDESSEDEDDKVKDIVKETPDVKVPRNVEEPVADASAGEIKTTEKAVAIPEAKEEEEDGEDESDSSSEDESDDDARKFEDAKSEPTVDKTEVSAAAAPVAAVAPSTEAEK